MAVPENVHNPNPRLRIDAAAVIGDFASLVWHLVAGRYGLAAEAAARLRRHGFLIVWQPGRAEVAR